jgi:hypothetical protein
VGEIFVDSKFYLAHMQTICCIWSQSTDETVLQASPAENLAYEAELSLPFTKNPTQMPADICPPNTFEDDELEALVKY